MRLGVLAFVFVFLMGPRVAYSRGALLLRDRVPYKKGEKGFLLSNLDFTSKGTPIIHFADISEPDPLTSCPLETVPADLEHTISQLVNQVRDSVSKIKQTQGEHCADLKKRIESSQSQIGTAFTNQFLAVNPSGATPSQIIINQQTQQANAINSLLLTASDIFRQECIQSMDDKIVIQKLIGQIVMLSGLFMGGWQGLAVAAGGQLIGNLPFFRNEIDRALEVFQQYEEKNERGSFLCLYRQMQKMSVLLFSNEDTPIIHGFDLSFKTGPAKTTLESIEKIKKENPDALKDVQSLRNIRKNSDKIMKELEDLPDLKSDSIETFHKLEHWCETAVLDPLQSNLHQPEDLQNLNQSLEFLRETCKDLMGYQVKVRTAEEVQKIELAVYWNISTLRRYYRRLSEKQLPLSEIAKTAESMVYFEDLKKSVEQFRDPSAGNQIRLNYRNLTESLGKGLANSTFVKMMNQNYKALIEYRVIDHQFAHDVPIRQRAIRAMLDACLVFDPTLTRLYIDHPEDHAIFRSWTKY